jgi:uncharacterized protein YndB with AHSA1/START domain
MPRLTASIDIAASREHVFATAADPAKQPEWTTFIKEISITSGDGKSEGTTDHTVIKVGPRPHKLEGTWTEYKPGEALARRFTGYMDLQERMAFATANGGTRVQWSVNYKPPFGVVGKFMAWFMMARIFQNELEASLENLKKTLED